MPTTPFSSTFVTNLQGPTAWRFDSELGPIFHPRFFCCTDPAELGIVDGKEPVAVINLSPNPAYTGETVSYAGTYSYDPDGSITGYDWDFESHTPSSGTASAGTLNYSTAGTYTIELIVEDGTGLKSSPARVELVVRPAEFQGYLATTNGVEYTDDQGTIEWTNLDVSYKRQNIYDVKIDPATQHLAENQKTIWRCGVVKAFATFHGVEVSNDGGIGWINKSPTSLLNSWSDSPEPTTDGLTYHQLLFTPTRLFVLATWQNSDSKWRTAVFYTSDFGKMRTDTSQTVTWTQMDVIG